MNQSLNAVLIITTHGRRRELNVTRQPVVIGSVPSCTIGLGADDGVAPLHARIERADGDVYVVAQSNSMVTKVNGAPLIAGRRRKLSAGDQIAVGRSTTIQFMTRHEAVASGTKPKASLLRRNAVFVVAIGCVTLLAGFVLLASGGRAKCSEVQVQLFPADSLVKTVAELQVTPAAGNCITRIEYFVDQDLKLDERRALPYNLKINPADPRLAKLGPSISHKLRLVIEDREGRKSEQSLPYAIGFAAPAAPSENIPFVIDENAGPTLSPGSSSPVPSPTGPAANANVSVPTGQRNPEAVQKINNLATFLSGEYDYALEDPSFYEQVQRTAQTLGKGYGEAWTRAQTSKERIRVEFSARNLKPALGYVLALSRSDFDVAARNEGSGLWQLVPAKLKAEAFITAQAELTDETRGPKVAANYTQSMYDIFEHNLLLTVAFYDISPAAAGELNARLAQQLNPQDRKSLPRLIKAGVIKERQIAHLVRFFAAAYVASYPWDFGIKTPSLSNIYG